MSAGRAELGRDGERVAERYLKKHGFKLLARRFNTPAGELDLVMGDGPTLVFVEVKTQRDRSFTDPELRVTPGKQRRLTRAARWFVAQKRWADRPCRFDVVSVILPRAGQREIRHFPDAFTPRRW